MPNRDPQRGRCSHSSSVVKFPFPLRGCFATLSGCFARGTVLLIFKVNSLSPLQYPHLHCTDRSTVQCQGYRCHPALQDKQQGSPKGTLFALFECREIPLPPAGVLRDPFRVLCDPFRMLRDRHQFSQDTRKLPNFW